MALILSIETATSACSVALHRRGVLIGKSELFVEKSHSGMLTEMINQLLQNVSCTVSDLQAIAVSKGPGSYTGLRIGLATAKGLCFGLNVPLIGINTLEGLLQQVRGNHHQMQYFCPMLDARRMEVYCMIANQEGQVVRETSAVIVDKDSFGSYLEGAGILFFGNGAAKCREVIQHAKAFFLDEVNASAAGIGELAYQRYAQGQFEDLAYFEPYYLKEFRTIEPTKKSGL